MRKGFLKIIFSVIILSGFMLSETAAFDYHDTGLISFYQEVNTRDKNDSVQENNLRIDKLKNTETEIVKLFEQNKIDSLLRMKLKEELNQYEENTQKKNELEARLKSIETADSIKKAEQLLKIKALKETAAGYPVNLFSDTLFVIYTKLVSFSTQERAAYISKKIYEIYAADYFYPDSLKIQTGDNVKDIYYMNVVIMTITETDALWYDRSMEEISEFCLVKIRDSIVKSRNEYSFYNKLKRFGFALLTLAGLIIFIKLIYVLFRKLSSYVFSKEDKYLSGVTLKNVRILNRDQSAKVIQIVIRIFRLIFVILALYFSLPVLFSIFPNTKGYTDILLSWVMNPASMIFNALIDYLPNLFTIIVIFFFTKYILKAVKYFAEEIAADRMSAGTFHKEWAIPTFQIFKFVMYALMFVIIFPYLPGSDSPAFQGVSVFLGILVSFGSSSSIANIMAGLVITYMRPFKIGDIIKISDVTGAVIEKTLLVTRIRTIKNEEVSVPNSAVLSGHTINYSTNAEGSGLILHTSVTIGYDVPWKKMHEALIEAASRTEFIMKEPKPFVLQTSLDDYYVAYQINAYTREPGKQALIYSELHCHIQDVCGEKGIEIMSPQYNSLRDGNHSTIPENYLPDDYKIPPFNIKEEKNKND